MPLLVFVVATLRISSELDAKRKLQVLSSRMAALAKSCLKGTARINMNVVQDATSLLDSEDIGDAERAEEQLSKLTAKSNRYFKALEASGIGAVFLAAVRQRVDASLEDKSHANKMGQLAASLAKVVDVSDSSYWSELVALVTRVRRVTSQVFQAKHADVLELADRRSAEAIAQASERANST